MLGTRSRQQHSRNLGSKKGNVFKVSSYSKTVLGSVVHTKKPRKTVYVAKAEKTKIHDNESDVVVAKPPKVHKQIDISLLAFHDIFMHLTMISIYDDDLY